MRPSSCGFERQVNVRRIALVLPWEVKTPVQ
jgi:hypothetical protein